MYAINIIINSKETIVTCFLGGGCGVSGNREKKASQKERLGNIFALYGLI